MSKIIDGRLIARKVFQLCHLKFALASKKYSNFHPKLAIIQVGNRKDSNIYIRNKLRTAQNSQIKAIHLKFDPSITQSQLTDQIHQLNLDKTINGIIVQLPLDTQTQIDQDTIINLVDPLKDVDGLTDLNTDHFLRREFDECFIPCTPRACMQMIDSINFDPRGRNVVMIGKSKLVGRPMADLMRFRGANVTLINSRSKCLQDLCRKADLLVVAIGLPKFIKSDWVQPGAVVIDCGINVFMDQGRERICGDVDYAEVAKVAGFITPVPGGVGPVTVSMLHLNTIEAAIRSCELKK